LLPRGEAFASRHSSLEDGWEYPKYMAEELGNKKVKGGCEGREKDELGWGGFVTQTTLWILP